MAIEAVLPVERRKLLKDSAYSRARYELAVGLHPDSGELALLAEAFWLMPGEWGCSSVPVQRDLFPQPPKPPETILLPPGRKAPPGWKKVVKGGGVRERLLLV